jgi:hypothetical protein
LFQDLVPALVRYGKLEDGRDALAAILEAAQNYVGTEKRQYCETLIQKIRFPESTTRCRAEDGDNAGQTATIQDDLQPILSSSQKKTPFQIKVWTSVETSHVDRDIQIIPRNSPNRYTIGETITVWFEATCDCYVTLIDIGTSGKITILLPNAYTQNNFIRAFQTYSFPDAAHGFKFTLSGPAGTEKIRAIATHEPVKIVETDVSKLNGAIFPMLEQRDIEIVATRMKALPEEIWAEALCLFEIREKNENPEYTPTICA